MREDNPQTLWQQDYQYQSDGELAKIIGNNARDYCYDEVGQLTSAGYPEANQDHHHAHHVETFKYDLAGNRISDNNSAAGNRLAFFGDRHFEYDRFGNLIAERRGTAHKLLTTYEYDCRHRLIKHVSPNGRVSTYTYDTFNRRTSKTVDGKKIEFIWQDNKLIAECSDKDTVWRSYLYEPDSFRPLALVEGNARKNQKIKTYWYQNDHLGTPHSLTDSLGNLVYSCSYNAYGKLQEETQHRQEEFGVRVETNLRFQGQYWDEETGLHYNFNRYYDPALGRYLTQDPVKLCGGLNLYAYVGSNPVKWIDPLGLLAGLGESQKAYKIQYGENTNVVDQSWGRQMGDIITEDPIANTSYRRLQEQGTTVKIVNDPHMAEMGEFNPLTNEVVINSARHSSGEEMASTLIHEATHANRKYNNKIPVWTQYEEYLSFRNELLFSLKRRPTLLERKAEYEKIRDLYPETSMPQGKNPFPLKGD